MKPHVSGNLGRTDMMKPVVGHNLNDQNGLPDGIRVAGSQSLHLSGYLLNHGRRWHAFLINVQVHNAKTASGTTVAIADKAKVYILMPVSATWPRCRHRCSTILRQYKKQTTQSKNGPTTWTDISPKKTCRWPTNTWKDAQHHSLLEKYKSKLQRDIISHRSEWPSSKNL